MIRVECRDDGRGTDLAGVQKELGLDYLGFHRYVENGTPFVSSEGGPACTSAECIEQVKTATDQAQAALAQPATDAEHDPWSTSGMAGRYAQVLVTAKGGTYTVIHNRSELRALLGAFDAPWKGHLWAHLTEKEINVSCNAYVGGGGSEDVDTTTYVSSTVPIRLIGIVPGASCSNEAIAYRVNLDVSTTGGVTETARTEIWRGPTACEGRIPDALSRAQVREVVRDSAASEGAYFARMAYFEEAAVHAFATLLEELAPHGLPDELRRDLERARRDEVRHARMMTELARRHGHEPERPTFEPHAARSLEQIAIENTVEGCVRETYGAVVGLYQAERAAHASVRRALRAIANDELFHADVSWRLGAWLESKLDDAARDRVHAARRAAITAQRQQLRQQHPSLDAAIGLPEPAIALAIHERLHRDLWSSAA